jgi:hypothetical protein
MKRGGIGTHSVHPYLEYFEALDKGKGVKIFPKGFAIDSLGGGFNPAENIRGLPEVNEMGEIVLMGAAGESHIDLHHISLEFLCDEKIDPEIQDSSQKQKTGLRACLLSAKIIFSFGVAGSLSSLRGSPITALTGSLAFAHPGKPLSDLLDAHPLHLLSRTHERHTEMDPVY